MAKAWRDNFWSDLRSFVRSNSIRILQRSIELWRPYIDDVIGNYVVAMSQDGVFGGFILADDPSRIESAVGLVFPFRSEITALLIPWLEDLFEPFINDIHARIQQNFASTNSYVAIPRRRRSRQMVIDLRRNRAVLQSVSRHIDELMEKFLEGFPNEIFLRTGMITTTGLELEEADLYLA